MDLKSSKATQPSNLNPDLKGIKQSYSIQINMIIIIHPVWEMLHGAGALCPGTSPPWTWRMRSPPWMVPMCRCACLPGRKISGYPVEIHTEKIQLSSGCETPLLFDDYGVMGDEKLASSHNGDYGNNPSCRGIPK